jgi:hypothetical protein
MMKVQNNIPKQKQVCSFGKPLSGLHTFRKFPPEVANLAALLKSRYERIHKIQDIDGCCG